MAVAMILRSLSICVVIGLLHGQTEIRLGLMGMINTFYGPPFQMERLGSAAYLAADYISQNSSILPNHTITFFLQNSGCDPKVALDGLVRLSNNNVDGIIGPTCSNAAEEVGLLASYWNIPVISYSAFSGKLSDKRVYDTFLRTVAPADLVADSVKTFVSQFPWQRIALLTRNDGGPLVTVESELKTRLEQDNVTVIEEYFSLSTDGRFAGPLENLKNSARSKC